MVARSQKNSGPSSLSSSLSDQKPIGIIKSTRSWTANEISHPFHIMKIGGLVVIWQVQPTFFLIMKAFKYKERKENKMNPHILSPDFNS